MKSLGKVTTHFNNVCGHHKTTWGWPAWSTEQVPGQPGLHRDPASKQNNSKNKPTKKKTWGTLPETIKAFFQSQAWHFPKLASWNGAASCGPSGLPPDCKQTHDHVGVRKGAEMFPRHFETEALCVQVREDPLMSNNQIYPRSKSALSRLKYMECSSVIGKSTDFTGIAIKSQMTS